MFVVHTSYVQVGFYPSSGQCSWHTWDASCERYKGLHDRVGASPYLHALEVQAGHSCCQSYEPDYAEPSHISVSARRLSTVVEFQKSCASGGRRQKDCLSCLSEVALSWEKWALQEMWIPDLPLNGRTPQGRFYQPSLVFVLSSLLCW